MMLCVNLRLQMCRLKYSPILNSYSNLSSRPKAAYAWQPCFDTHTKQHRVLDLVDSQSRDLKIQRELAQTENYRAKCGAWSCGLSPQEHWLLCRRNRFVLNNTRKARPIGRQAEESETAVRCWEVGWPIDTGIRTVISGKKAGRLRLSMIRSLASARSA